MRHHPTSLQSRRELLAGASKRYVKADGSQRTRILDEFVASTGYERNYAIHLLNHPPVLPSAKRGRRPRSKTYGSQVQHALEKLWCVAGGICGKRLAPFLPDLIESLERHGEIALSAQVREKLLNVSAATCDRLLAKARAEHPGRGLCTTRPSPHLLLRSQIPVRTFSDWDETRPGFMEVDLVAHCGDTTRGSYLFTLCAVDVAYGWIGFTALPNKSLLTITAAMDHLRQTLPYSLLGIDTDNGGEFINHNLVKYCAANRITMTRCRPYKKNDHCHVEQKNGNVVRAVTGYARYESSEALAALRKLYVLLADYQNFFQPSTKLIAKARDGAKVAKTYDKPKTPYKRLIESEHIAEEVKDKLLDRYKRLNPAAIHKTLINLRNQLRASATAADRDTQGAFQQLPELYNLQRADPQVTQPTSMHSAPTVDPPTEDARL